MKIISHTNGGDVNTHFPVLQEKDQLKGDVTGILSFDASSEMENSLFLYMWEKGKVETSCNKENGNNRNRKVSCILLFSHVWNLIIFQQNFREQERSFGLRKLSSACPCIFL